MGGPAADGVGRPGRRLLRALMVLATSTLVVCGVKGPPRPPVQETPPADAGQGAGPSPVEGSDAGAPQVPSK